MTLRELVVASKAEIEAILLEPADDPEAPPGYVRRLWSEAELRRREAAAAIVIERLLGDIERRFGPVPAACAREHFGALLVELGGAMLH